MGLFSSTSTFPWEADYVSAIWFSRLVCNEGFVKNDLLIPIRKATNWFPISLPVRFKVLSNNHLQIRGIKKSDEGAYTCEGRIMARGEIDLRVIKVIVNGEESIQMHGKQVWKPGFTAQSILERGCYHWPHLCGYKNYSISGRDSVGLDMWIGAYCIDLDFIYSTCSFFSQFCPVLGLVLQSSMPLRTSSRLWHLRVMRMATQSPQSRGCGK